VTHSPTLEQQDSVDVILATASLDVQFCFILTYPSSLPSTTRSVVGWLSILPPTPSSKPVVDPSPIAIMAANDNAMTRFLFAILQQKCLKDVSCG
jgi:hypothetical protein